MYTVALYRYGQQPYRYAIVTVIPVLIAKFLYKRLSKNNLAVSLCCEGIYGSVQYLAAIIR